MLRIGRLLTFIFVFAVAGGHWGVMQVVAWSTMAANSESGSLIEAVMAEPCEICIAISEGTQEDKGDPKSATNAKLEGLALDELAGVILPAPRVVCKLADVPLAMVGISDAPAHGPPRFG